MDHNNSPNPNSNDPHPQHRNPHISINKLSHKIAKPSPSIHKPQLDPAPPPPSAIQNPTQNPNPPPVYNISKSDFRDMVQKLTGPPPSELAEMARAAQAPRPPVSRLHRIRPPPLAQLSSFPAPPMGSVGGQVQNLGGNLGAFQGVPLSPLPPLPSVHAAAESPISAYMRHLRGSGSGVGGGVPLSGFSPRFQQDLGIGHPPPPSSPLGFGCVPSPKSTNLPAGKLGLPLSPTGKP